MSGRANGEHTIYRRKDCRWAAVVFVPTNTGGRKRVWVYGRTRPEAKQKQDAMLRDVEAGMRVSVENWNVQTYLDYWLHAVVKPNRAPKTYQGYELAVRLHIGPHIGKKKLRALTVRDVRLMCEDLASGHLGRGGVQRVHAVLRAGLQNAMRDELIVRNVAKLVQVPASGAKVGRALSPQEGKALLAAAESDRFHALYVLAVYLGLRRGELLGLQWKHVDLDKQPLRVEQTLQRVDGRVQLLPPKTRYSRRTVPLPRR